ncbi:hypothetical protein AADZ90_000480 [Aestuariibius sp. 2305UL40-4]|uniref:hypothetical protein n=1 Tax=Aestuariibius violaceus TaxID=3234132 RepID=UPI00345EB559
MRKSFLLSAVLSCAVTAAMAQIDNRAVDLWLDGDDAAALPELADAAEDGDTEAQLLLGLIDRDTVPGGYSRYVLSLADQERDALLRAPVRGGTRNWLLEQNGDAQAVSDALFNYRVALDPVPMAVALQQEGEEASASFLLWTVLDNGRFDRLTTVPAENYGLLDMDALEWLRAYQERSDKTLTMTTVLEDDTPGKVPGLLLLARLAPLLGLEDKIRPDVRDTIDVLRGRQPEERGATVLDINPWLDQLAESDPHLDALKRYCDICPEAGGDTMCMSDALAVISGYRTLMTVRSPIERVIPAEAYFTSDRPVQLLEDLVRNRMSYYPGRVNSSCIQARMSEAFQ